MNSQEKTILLFIKYVPTIVIMIISSLVLDILYLNNRDLFKIYYENFIYFYIFILIVSLFLSFLISYSIKRIFLNYHRKILKNIEENKKRDLYIFQQSKLITISELMKNISHYWRQHLSIISTIASGLKLKKEIGINNQKEEIDFLEIIVENTKYLSKILDNFKDAYGTDSEKSIFYIKDLIDKIIEIIQKQFEIYGIDVEHDIKNFQLNSYKNLLIQVILNLLNNSRDEFLKKEINNRIVKIKTYESDTDYFICFTDNAGGIEEENLDRIFEPFFSTKHQSNGNGTGIGLYMSYQIISKVFNGNILVKNEKVKHNNNLYDGVVFEIKIPK